VRVIDEKGKQLGVLKISDALKKAQESNLDLVEIAAKAKPPVTKIVSLGKFKYQQEKKQRDQKKKTKQTNIKEVRFSPFIGDADYQTRLGRVDEFLGEGHKIRAVVKFKGRQMGSKSFGYNLLKKLLTELGDNVNIDMEPKFLGRHLSMVISPVKKSKKTKKPQSKTSSPGGKQGSRSKSKKKSATNVKSKKAEKVKSESKTAKRP
jgi:translation initiation factor IF-3